MHHQLDIWPVYFEAVLGGDKTFEVREKRDRVFGVGDIVTLNCFSPESGRDGRYVTKRISYTLDDERFCLPGYVIFGLRDI